MSTVAANSQPALTPFMERIPPLQSGDHLTRDEFERRYHATPKNIKAELIEGIVYVLGPPVSDSGHSRPHFRFITWLGVYESHTPGTVGGDNGTVRLDVDNEPQPDAHLRILAEYGGQSRLSADNYVEGAPELVAEIAASSVTYDLHEKLNAYRKCGVREYIVWRVWDQAIDWFKLHDGEFVPHSPDKQGLYKSTVFPGLWLDAPALLAGNQKEVLAALEQGLASADHQEFVERLNR